MTTDHVIGEGDLLPDVRSSITKDARGGSATTVAARWCLCCTGTSLDCRARST